MPCRYDPTPEEIRQEKEKAKAALIKPYRAKLDKLTRLLCEATKQMKRNPSISKELENWITQHRKEDKAREKAELKREIKKLQSKLKKL